VQDTKLFPQNESCKVNLPLGKNIGIFYLPHMIQFENFEFVFAIKGPKFSKRCEEHKINTTQNFYKTQNSPCVAHFVRWV